MPLRRFSASERRKEGGRWNSPGTGIVYTAGSLSLAILEMLVHLETLQVLNRYVSFEIAFEDSLMTALDPAVLPPTWRQSPPAPAVQQMGDRWIARAESAVLRVPSAVVPSEWNYLVNPDHPDFPRISPGPQQPMEIDARLVKTPA